MKLAVAVVIIVALFATYLALTASRITRLHARVDAAQAALDAQLVRRAAAAEALPRAALGEHAEAVRQVARTAREADAAHREAAENDLSRLLRQLALDADAPELRELVAAVTRVGFARHFYNDAVRDTRAVRRQRLVWLLRLGAARPLPGYFEIDDSGLGTAGSSTRSGLG